MSKAFGEKVLLDNVTLGINKGDKIGIIGVNGTGKSTLLKIIAGIEEPDEGNIIKEEKLLLHILHSHQIILKMKCTFICASWQRFIE